MAAARDDADHWRVSFVWAAVGLALWVIWASQASIRARNALAARIDRDALVKLACALLFAFALQAGWTAAAALAPVFWPTGAGHTDVVGMMSALPAKALVGGLCLWLLLRARERWPRWGWAGLSGFAALVVLGAVVVAPVALIPTLRGDRPVPTAPGAAKAIADFVQKGRLNAQALYVFDGGDPFGVDMEGLGPFAHAAVSRAALAAPRPETYAAIGHLLGHYRHKDLWSLTLLWSGLATAFFWSVWACAGSRTRKAAHAASSAADAARLPLVGLIGWALILLAVPVFNIFDQAINYRADDYAMTLTHDPDALCRWLIATEVGGKVDPSPLETLLFYDHPPLKPRLDNALRWKARHPSRQDAGF